MTSPISLLSYVHARLRHEVLPRLTALRAQVVHSDGHADNLLRATPDSDEIVGVIDFGDMVHVPLVQDLAVTLASFARHGEMSLENAVAQVEAWNAVLPLMDDEIEILHDLTLLRRATALTLYDFKIHWTEKPEAWLLEERPAIVRALSKFLAFDREEVHERYRAACGRVGRAPASIDIESLRQRRRILVRPALVKRREDTDDRPNDRSPDARPGEVTMETPAIPDLTGTQALYDRIAPGYHRWWAPVIEPAPLRLLDLVAPAIDIHQRAILVDVGAGTGPLARAAARGGRRFARSPSTRRAGCLRSGGMRPKGRSIDLRSGASAG